MKAILEAGGVARAGRPRPDRRRQRRRRARQHHRDPVPRRGRRRRPGTRRRRDDRVRDVGGRGGRRAAPGRHAAGVMPATRRRPSIAGRGRWPCPRSSREPSRSRSRRGAPRRCRQRAKRRRRRIPGAAIAVLIVLRIVLAGLWTASRAVYFVGVDDDTRDRDASTAACRTSCRSGSTSTQRDYTSGVRIEQVPAARRADVHRPQAAVAGRREEPRDRARAGPARVSARNRELLALIPASLLLTAGFAAIFIQESGRPHRTSR